MSIETTSEPRIPEAPDRDEIVRLDNLYINGFGLDKPELFQEVFHRRARIYFIQPDGTLWGTTDEDWLMWEPDGFAGWASSAEHPHGSHGQIFEVIQTGDLACVLEAMGDHESFGPRGDIGWWVDIHTLLRLEGTWKVMAKTASHASHGGWAGLEPPGTPTTPDRDEILRVVNLYVDGFHSGKPEMFEEAFHPAANYYWKEPDGTLAEGKIYERIKGWSEDRGGHAEARILRVIQAGDVALVLLRWDPYDGEVPGEPWIDIHTLLRLDGTWKIMAKTATHGSLGGWAGKA